jgi:hypothetical protein
MIKGTAIKFKDCKVGERYCLGKSLRSEFSFIIVELSSTHVKVVYDERVKGSFSSWDMIVFTNPMTELEKALL